MNNIEFKIYYDYQDQGYLSMYDSGLNVGRADFKVQFDFNGNVSKVNYSNINTAVDIELNENKATKFIKEFLAV